MKTGKDTSIARELIAFSLPLILSGLLQQLYNWVDAFIVGHAEGELQLAAVGATSTISVLLINTILGFALGLSVIAAQSCGRGDAGKLRRLLSGFMPILGVGFLLLAVVMILLAEPILRLMDTPPEIFGYAMSYLRIVLLGMPFLACYNLCAALLRAMGDSKSAFYAVLVSSGINVVFDLLFVVALRMGVGGAALATVLAQVGMAAFIYRYIARRHPEMMRRADEARFDRGVLREGMRMSLTPIIQNNVTSAGNLVLQGFMNGFGAVTVLAITTAYRVDSLMLLPILNLGDAMASMTGRAKGAGDLPRVRRCVKNGLLLMLAISLGLAAVMYLFGAQFVSIFGVSGAALEEGGMFFRDLSAFYVLFGMSMVFRGALQGLGDVQGSSLIGIASLAVRILFSYLLRPWLGTRTIAFAESIAWFALLAMMLARFLQVWRREKAAANL